MKPKRSAVTALKQDRFHVPRARDKQKYSAICSTHLSSAISPLISSNSVESSAGFFAYVHPRSFAIRRNTFSLLVRTCTKQRKELEWGYFHVKAVGSPFCNIDPRRPAQSHDVRSTEESWNVAHILTSSNKVGGNRRKRRLYLRDLDDLPGEQTVTRTRSRLLRIGAYPLRQRVIHHAVEEPTLQPDRKTKQQIDRNVRRLLHGESHLFLASQRLLQTATKR